jgi:hypothetical protein
MEINSVEDILKWEQSHAALKASAILRLLKEREDLEANTEARLKAIKGELAALGYTVKRPRKAKP